MAAPQKITIRYGSYVHPYGTTTYSVQRQTVFNARRAPHMEAQKVSIQGLVHGDNPTDLANNFATLSAAYDQTGVDFSIQVDGTDMPVFTLFDSNVLGGIRVTQKPSIPATSGGAHLKYLPFQVELEAMVPYVSSAFALLSFQETLSFSGGGPVTSMIEALYGPPQKQQTREQSVYRCTQSGNAVAMFGLPYIPDPIFGIANLVRGGDSSRGGGDPWTATSYGRSASWSYQYESATPLVGLPNEWGTIL